MTATPLADDGDAKATLDRLWHEFKDRSSFDARGQLMQHYLPLVKYVASRVATSLPGDIEPARLASYGIYGLYGALET